MTTHRKTDDIFAGVRVIDFTHVLAGPYCTRLLADLGADVIKIERPGGGDESRQLPLVLEPGHSGYFLQYNCGKRSLAVDIKHPRGGDIVRRLIASGDVVIENFRPGAMVRAGLGYAALGEINPRLIMCSISAFGQSGPRAVEPGHGLMAEALGGVIGMTGDPDGPPMPPGISVADIAAGIFAFGAISAALYRRATTGQGDYIDLALLDCVLPFHEISLQEHLVSGRQLTRRRSGLEHAAIVPYGVYRARDGYLSISAVSEHVWKRLVDAMGKPDLADKYPSNEARLTARTDITEQITEWLQTFPSPNAAAAVLAAAGVPNAVVNGIDEVPDEPQLRHRKMFVSHADPVAGPVELVRSPLHFSGVSTDLRGDAPRLGEHTEAILTEIGCTPTEIGQLVAEGVVAVHPGSS